MFLGTPLTLTVEGHHGGDAGAHDRRARALIGLELQRPPKAAQDWGLMRLSPRLLPTTDTTYAALRYVDRVALLSQRWSWRGRPQDDRWPVLDGSKDQEAAIDRLFETAFLDRSHDDVGDIIERGLTVAHVYAGRTQITQKATTSSGPYLCQKNLDYRAGVNLWRFAGASLVATRRCDNDRSWWSSRTGEAGQKTLTG